MPACPVSDLLTVDPMTATLSASSKSEENRMNYSIEKVEGIGKTYRRKLAKAGVKTTGALLRTCCLRTGRREISKETGLTEAQLLKWANMADLMRVKGVGPEYSELLERAGVDTVKELRRRRADKLAEAMTSLNQKKKLTRRPPGQQMVEGWIASAKALDPVIRH